MKPTFRSDLTCSREEQQGVVFYRIDDPKSQTNFRLYEIEYLIAKKLDGSRILLEVIEAVKSEFNFDISESDLQRFVNQLDSMNFLVTDGSGQNAANNTPETETRVMKNKEKGQTLDLLDASGLQEKGGDVDAEEYDRLLRTAFLHVKQGYITHARDYFLAAREIKPSEDRLKNLVHQLDVLNDTKSIEDIKNIWNQAAQVFPEIAVELGAPSEIPHEDNSEGEMPINQAQDNSPTHEDLRSRLLWLGVLIVIFLGASSGIYLVFSSNLLESAANVSVATIQSERVPVFYKESATHIKSVREQWLNVGTSGRVTKIHIKSDTKVAEGDVLLELELPAPIAKQLQQAQKAYKKAQSNYQKAARQLEKIISERESIELERSNVQEKMRKPEITKMRAQKKKLEKIIAKANKKLTQLTKKERGPRTKVNKARKKEEEAAKKISAIRKKAANKIISAPFSGTVVLIKTSVGQPVGKTQKLILLKDQTAIALDFKLKEAPSWQIGGEAYVAVERARPIAAKVLGIEKIKNAVNVVVKLPDPAGGFLISSPNKFKLVKEYVEPAYRIPARGILTRYKLPRVIIAIQNRAVLREIEILHQDADSAVIRDSSGMLRNGKQIVTSRLDNGDINSIEDGYDLKIKLP